MDTTPPTPSNPSKAAKDAMTCRACGREERASEGYPCAKCGTFICLICTFRGVIECNQCASTSGGAPATPA